MTLFDVKASESYFLSEVVSCNQTEDEHVTCIKMDSFIMECYALYVDVFNS